MIREIKVSTQWRFKINQHHLVFDIILALYAKFFLYKVFVHGNGLHNVMGPVLFMIFGIFSIVILTWYFGGVIKDYKDTLGAGKTLTFIVVISFLILVATYFTTAMNVNYLYDIKAGPFLYFGYIFSFSIGLILGLVFGFTEFDNTNLDFRKLLLERIKLVKMMSGYIFGLPAGAICFIGSISWAIKYGDIGMFMGFGVAACVFFIPRWLINLAEKKMKKAIDREEQEQKTESVFKSLGNIVFPFLVATALCVNEEIYITSMIKSSEPGGTIAAFPSMILYLCLTGVIPLRIILAFKPPFTVFGIITGISTISFFLFSIYNILG